MDEQELNENTELKQDKIPKYESPEIITYTSEEILEEIGPAQTCISPCPVIP